MNSPINSKQTFDDLAERAVSTTNSTNSEVHLHDDETETDEVTENEEVEEENDHAEQSASTTRLHRSRSNSTGSENEETITMNYIKSKLGMPISKFVAYLPSRNSSKEFIENQLSENFPHKLFNAHCIVLGSLALILFVLQSLMIAYEFALYQVGIGYLCSTLYSLNLLLHLYFYKNRSKEIYIVNISFTMLTSTFVSLVMTAVNFVGLFAFSCVVKSSHPRQSTCDEYKYVPLSAFMILIGFFQTVWCIWYVISFQRNSGALLNRSIKVKHNNQLDEKFSPI